METPGTEVVKSMGREDTETLNTPQAIETVGTNLKARGFRSRARGLTKYYKGLEGSAFEALSTIGIPFVPNSSHDVKPWALNQDDGLNWHVLVGYHLALDFAVVNGALSHPGSDNSKLSVMEVGCGRGGGLVQAIRPRMQGCADTLVGIDIMDHLIEFAQNKFATYQEGADGLPTLEFRTADFTAGGIEDRFHFVIAMNVLFAHFETEESLSRAAEVLTSLVYPGGHLVIMDHIDAGSYGQGMRSFTQVGFELVAEADVTSENMQGMQECLPRICEHIKAQACDAASREATTSKVADNYRKHTERMTKGHESTHLILFKNMAIRD